jgi:WD40 repeat protein/formylglycine-generating enzyme required for sulfatase activity/murein DD-endopeptidase MepM/ murein hydrolase activator NlpD/roadblock/LC7 domain-containing protein
MKKIVYWHFTLKALSLLVLVFLLFAYQSEAQIAIDYPVKPWDQWVVYKDSNFGDYRKSDSAYHSGVDLTLKDSIKDGVNKPVYAIADGQVFKVDERKLGWSVVIKHTSSDQQFIIPEHNSQEYKYKQEKVSTIYSVYIHIKPIDKLAKKITQPNGVTVKKGEIIGYINEMPTGIVPHLHFEIRHSDAKQSPGGSMLYPNTNWSSSGDYLNMQKLIESGARNPLEFLKANVQIASPVGDSKTDLTDVKSEDFFPLTKQLTLPQVINPKKTNNNWVSDMAGIISDEDETSINTLIDQLEKKTSAEIAVVTVESVGDMTPKNFAHELFNFWGIGKKGKDNGILVFLVMDVKRIEIETGYGTQRVLTDGKVGEILDTYIMPKFREGDFGKGIFAGVQAMGDIMRKVYIMSSETNQRFTEHSEEQVSVPPTITEKDGMVLIPAGEFQMGDSLDGMSEALPVHTVYLDAFYIDKYEVTNAQYQKFKDSTGYEAPYFWNDINYNAPNQPVVGVSWKDAKAYADWAGKQLPTEAEWEKAARGGLSGKRYVWGDEWPPPTKAGNFADESAKRVFSGWTIITGYDDGYAYPAPAGSFKANGYGLYDMAGNVWEWCADWWAYNYYVNSPKSNPKGPDSGSYKVLRGGSWGHYYGGQNLRTADRTYDNPAVYSDNIGFRCVYKVTDPKLVEYGKSQVSVPYEDVTAITSIPDMASAPPEGIGPPAKIDVTFNQDVDPTTVMVKVMDATSVEVVGTVAPDAADPKMFSFTPAAPIKGGDYTAIVSGAKGMAAQNVMADMSVAFKVKEVRIATPAEITALPPGLPDVPAPPMEQYSNLPTSSTKPVTNKIQTDNTVNNTISSAQILPEGAIARFGKGCINPKGVAFSPDSKIIAMATSVGVELYNSSTFDEVSFLVANARINSVKFSSDSKLLAGYGNAEIKLWDMNNFKELVSLKASDSIEFIDFSPDSNLLAYVDKGKTVKLWNLKSYQLATSLEHSDSISSFIFSPDGKLLAVANNDVVKLWDTKSYKEINTLKGNLAHISSLTFSPDSSLLTAVSGTAIKIWDMRNYQLVTTLDHPNGSSSGPEEDWEGVNSVTFSPNGSLLASVNLKTFTIGMGSRAGYTNTTGGTLKFWDMRKYKEVTVIKTNLDTVTSVSFSPDGNMIAIGCSDNKIRLYKVKDGSEIITLNKLLSGITVTSIIFSPDSKLMVNTGFIWLNDSNRILQLWDMKNFKEIVIPKGYLLGPVEQVAFCSSGKLLVSWHEKNIEGSEYNKNSEIIIWDAKKFDKVGILEGHSGYVSSFAFSPDGDLLASLSGSDEFKLWEVNNHKEISNIKPNKNVDLIELSPDGSLLIGSTSDGKLKLWDVKTYKELVNLDGEEPVCFSPDSRLLAYTNKSQDSIIVKLWDIKNKKEIGTFKEEADFLLFSQDSKLLAFGVSESRNEHLPVAEQPWFRGDELFSNKVDLWNVTNFQKVATIREPKEGPLEITSIAFSPNGRLIEVSEGVRGFVSEGRRTFDEEDIYLKEVKIWDAKALNEVITLNTLYDKDSDVSITVTAFSPDSNLIAIGGDDNTVKLWNVRNHREVATLKGHSGYITSIAFSADGSLLASGSEDGTVLLWDMKPYKKRQPDSMAPSTVIELSGTLKSKGVYTSDDAIASYSEAIRINPKNAESWNNKGSALSKVEKYQDAVVAYEEAIKINPKYVEAWINKGTALDKLGRFDEAVASSDEAIKIDPNYVEAWINKSISLSKLKKYEEAIASCDEAIKIDPNIVKVWTLKGVDYILIKNYKKALECFEKAISLEQDPAKLEQLKGMKQSLLKKLGE